MEKDYFKTHVYDIKIKKENVVDFIDKEFFYLLNKFIKKKTDFCTTVTDINNKNRRFSIISEGKDAKFKKVQIKGESEPYILYLDISEESDSYKFRLELYSNLSYAENESVSVTVVSNSVGDTVMKCLFIKVIQLWYKEQNREEMFVEAATEVIGY